MFGCFKDKSFKFFKERSRNQTCMCDLFVIDSWLMLRWFRIPKSTIHSLKTNWKAMRRKKRCKWTNNHQRMTSTTRVSLDFESREGVGEGTNPFLKRLRTDYAALSSLRPGGWWDSWVLRGRGGVRRIPGSGAPRAPKVWILGFLILGACLWGFVVSVGLLEFVFWCC